MRDIAIAIEYEPITFPWIIKKFEQKRKKERDLPLWLWLGEWKSFGVSSNAFWRTGLVANDVVGLENQFSLPVLLGSGLAESTVIDFVMVRWSLINCVYDGFILGLSKFLSVLT